MLGSTQPDAPRIIQYTAYSVCTYHIPDELMTMITDYVPMQVLPDRLKTWSTEHSWVCRGKD